MKERMQKLIDKYADIEEQEGGYLEITPRIHNRWLLFLGWRLSKGHMKYIWKFLKSGDYTLEECEGEILLWEENLIHPVIAWMATIQTMDELKYQLIALSIAYASSDMALREHSDWNIDVMEN